MLISFQCCSRGQATDSSMGDFGQRTDVGGGHLIAVCMRWGHCISSSCDDSPRVPDDLLKMKPFRSTGQAITEGEHSTQWIVTETA